MRISKGYWLWGLFPLKEKSFLDEIKFKVQKKLKSPFFETHITLSGPYFDIDNVFLDKLKIFTENYSSIVLTIDGYEFKQEIFKSFYIRIKISKSLKELRRNIHKLKNFDLTYTYSPHISLCYGNHEIKEKQELLLKLPKLNKSIEMSKIALVEVNEDLKRWKILESFDLI